MNDASSSPLPDATVDRLQPAFATAPAPVRTWLASPIDTLLAEVPFRIATLHAPSSIQETPRLLTTNPGHTS